MHILAERWYPAAAGLAVTGGWWYWCDVPKAGLHDLFATAVSLASIVVGFLATAMSIVLAAPDSRIMRQLRESKYINELVRYMREPFIVGLGLAAVSLAGYFISDSVASSRLFVGLLVFLTATLIGGLLRIAIVFMHYLKAASFRDSGSARP